MPANITNILDQGIDLSDQYISLNELDDVSNYLNFNGLDLYYTPGSLWAWGDNRYGQVAQGNTINRSSPVQVGTLTNWKLVAGGKYHGEGIKTDGTLWGWGDNNWGAVGINNGFDNVLSPVQIGSSTEWKQVACGEESTVAIKTDGSLWAWGRNGYGQLGLSGSEVTPVQVGTLTNWKQVASGKRSTLAVKMDDTLWAWGYNAYGGLGLGDRVQRSSPVQVGTLTDWKSVASGTASYRFGFSAAIKKDGTLWTWGYNYNGSLGLGNTIHKSSPVQVGALTNWKQITCGAGILAVKTDGTLWAWGYGGDGQLGLGNTNTMNNSPIQVGTLTNWKSVTTYDYHTLAVKTDGTLWSWGAQQFGALGIDDTSSRSSPVQVGSLTNWKFAATGKTFSLAIN